LNIVKKRLREFYDRCLSLRGDPKDLARGLALGVFIGVTPTIPFHTALIVMIGTAFRLNITAAYLGSWLISNPVTIPLFYLFQYRLGVAVLGMPVYDWAITEYTLSAVLYLGAHILIPLLTGGVIMAPFFGIPAYFLAYRFLRRVRPAVSS